ncbi:MAG: TM2 domain-containing protein [Clostridiales bacterium]|nr:TM2 domain-containing protein [Eubacterium sp.]MDD5994172.1 TM2 domain-containing protein [Clostridiales bacterium]MDD7349399.1 TM2 domain-containing protein [Clostridiales bacterium]
MEENKCPQCGAPIDPGATECKFCGEKLAVQQAAQQVQQPQPQVVIQQAAPQQVYVTGINPSWPIKNKIAAGLLGIFLGAIGVHKFYMGKIGMGILYLCFCWTGIPAIVGFIEGIIYLCSNDENFQLKNHVRIE